MSNSFENNVIQTWGDKGCAWLKALPSLLAILLKHWHLTNLTPIANLSYNYVVAAQQGITPVILKIGCDQKDIQKELITLKAYDGNGCVRLLDSNLEYNALLLEKAIPGTSLIPFFPDRDDEALEHTVTVMRLLHAAPIPSGIHLPTIQEEFKDLYEPDPALNAHHIRKAQELAQHLFATQQKPVLLHGDLHHGNILLSQSGWLAIDPKGLIADPAYEVYAFVRNPCPEILKPRKLVLHRLELFAEYLSIDKQRLHAWVYVRAVLEACWAMKDGQANPDIALAEAKQVELL
jgi:streptomycin 6-kinase